ncbi:MAG TPA: DUF3182 family protein [Spongiibacteraceae bacterium]
MLPAAVTNGRVVTYAPKAECTEISDHETASLARMTEKIAALKGWRFAGEYHADMLLADKSPNNPDANEIEVALYFVPKDTLLHAQAAALGIKNENQLFGGSVPSAVMATKSITHGLIHAEAAAAPGWTGAFAAEVAPVVLNGYSVFCNRDAHHAARELLKRGQIRVKRALGIGGSGQFVVANLIEFEVVLATIDATECAEYGIVIEQNLASVTTYSVGTVTIADLRVSYCGMQNLTLNSKGHHVYGGSTLRAVRGNFSALKQLCLPAEAQLAVTQASIYDAATNAHISGFFASRRNYDVAQGLDSNGSLCSGVLEPSWRIGGASPAEIAALEAFATHPNLISVRTSCHEVYGAHAAPAHAQIYFCGDDARVGTLIKYSTVDSYEYCS